jgi:hypothetical protein
MNRMACLKSIIVAVCGVMVAAPPFAGAQNTLSDSMQMPDSMQIDDSMQMSDSMVVDTPPPPIPTYTQPPVVAPGYIWTPGYWAWGPAGYFWVPGAWALPPSPGLLWTPGYWCWSPVALGFMWSPGYWGLRVGFYGGINYGFGYFGRGYVGGRWYGNHFFYNTAVTHVNTRFVGTVYVNRTVIVNNATHVSYNGGRGGIVAQPSATGLAIPRRQAMTSIQVQRERVASQNRNQLAGVTQPRNRPTGFEHIRPEDRAAAHVHARRIRSRSR